MISQESFDSAMFSLSCLIPFPPVLGVPFLSTTDEVKKILVPGHDDSGYDGLGSVSKETVVKERFNADEVRRLFENCSSSSHDELWVTMANYTMIAMVGACVVYLIFMGEDGNDPRVGGKRAAIQHYYNSVYGVEDESQEFSL